MVLKGNEKTQDFAGAACFLDFPDSLAFGSDLTLMLPFFFPHSAKSRVFCSPDNIFKEDFILRGGALFLLFLRRFAWVVITCMSVGEDEVLSTFFKEVSFFSKKVIYFYLKINFVFK